MASVDKALLGIRYLCFQCGTRFYDLNRPAPICPACNANQQEAPVRDMKAILTSRGGPAPPEPTPPAPAALETEEDADDDEELESTEDDSAEEGDELGSEW